MLIERAIDEVTGQLEDVDDTPARATEDGPFGAVPDDGLGG
jgi:hypothetical protein